MVSFHFILREPAGFAAKAAGDLVGAALKCSSKVTILDGEKPGDAKQIFHVMCLSARENDDIELRLEGPDEVAEARMLEQYVRERF